VVLNHHLKWLDFSHVQSRIGFAWIQRLVQFCEVRNVVINLYSVHLVWIQRNGWSGWDSSVVRPISRHIKGCDCLTNDDQFGCVYTLQITASQVEIVTKGRCWVVFRSGVCPSFECTDINHVRSFLSKQG
jgi:hypothetical protein